MGYVAFLGTLLCSSRVIEVKIPVSLLSSLGTQAQLRLITRDLLFELLHEKMPGHSPTWDQTLPRQVGTTNVDYKTRRPEWNQNFTVRWDLGEPDPPPDDDVSNADDDDVDEPPCSLEVAMQGELNNQVYGRVRNVGGIRTSCVCKRCRRRVIEVELEIWHRYHREEAVAEQSKLSTTANDGTSNKQEQSGSSSADGGSGGDGDNGDGVANDDNYRGDNTSSKKPDNLYGEMDPTPVSS